MSKHIKYLTALAFGVAAAGLVAAGPASAKVEGDTIIIGSAISFTGKYSTNGIHASNGYNLGVKRVNEMGGVKVGGKMYKLNCIDRGRSRRPDHKAVIPALMVWCCGLPILRYNSANVSPAAGRTAIWCP